MSVDCQKFKTYLSIAEDYKCVYDGPILLDLALHKVIRLICCIVRMMIAPSVSRRSGRIQRTHCIRLDIWCFENDYWSGRGSV